MRSTLADYIFPSFFFLVSFPRSLESQEPAENQLEATDLQYGQLQLSEHYRLMREACQFDQYNREHPLEKWTVGSLPNLYKCSLVMCHPRYWEV